MSEAPTPVELWGDVHVARGDLLVLGPANGGKVRAILAMARAANAPGLVCAGAKHSAQGLRTAAVATHLGIPSRFHTGQGHHTPLMLAAAAAGAEVVQHHPGRMVVLIARARTDAAARGWLDIPLGLEAEPYVASTAAEVAHVADVGMRRIVVPTGSGMTLAGVLRGMTAVGLDVPVLAVDIGFDARPRLNRWAPGWESRVEVVRSPLRFEEVPAVTELAGLALEPHFEAKCLPYLEPGDLLWIVGGPLAPLGV